MRVALLALSLLPLAGAHRTEIAEVGGTTEGDDRDRCSTSRSPRCWSSPGARSSGRGRHGARWTRARTRDWIVSAALLTAVSNSSADTSSSAAWRTSAIASCASARVCGETHGASSNAFVAVGLQVVERRDDRLLHGVLAAAVDRLLVLDRESLELHRDVRGLLLRVASPRTTPTARSACRAASRVRSRRTARPPRRGRRCGADVRSGCSGPRISSVPR